MRLRKETFVENGELVRLLVGLKLGEEFMTSRFGEEFMIGILREVY